MAALVEPPRAICTAIALSKLPAVRMHDGLRSSDTMATMRAPQSVAMRVWAASIAGIEEAPGSVRPSASTMMREALGHTAILREIHRYAMLIGAQRVDAYTSVRLYRFIRRRRAVDAEQHAGRCIRYAANSRSR